MSKLTLRLLSVACGMMALTSALANTNASAANNSDTQLTANETIKKTATEIIITKKLSDGTIIKVVEDRKTGMRYAYVTKKGKTKRYVYPPEKPAITKAEQARNESVTTGRGSPNASIAAPNAFGGSAPTIFGSMSWVNRWPSTNPSDGAVSGGVGGSFGNPYKYVGVLLSYNQNAFGLNSGSSFGQNGNISIRLNRYFNPSTAIAIGMGNMVGWGTNSGIARSYYVSLTHSMYVLFPIAINVGCGSGGFASPTVTYLNDSQWYPFASMGVGFFDNFSGIVDWTSKQINLGAAYTITHWPKVPIFIGAYAMNLNQYASTNPYFQLSAGLSYSFGQ